ncbi:hypothetical protein Raf01_75210 [Rugosimonospora africana]|uniref:Uncharacterized protein n=1 Tax=Rugosimonospora africana TaxID=556532 RepID=A0A8J3R002_9ACTN|nr:hypothetical protein Raf01_75210 [Rugosimonospora africana]
MPYQPPAGLPHSLPVGPQCRGGDVLVAVDRYVDVVERVGEFAWWRIGLGEVPVEDGGDVGALESPIFWRLGSRPPTVEFVIGIRLAVARQNAVRTLLMKAKSVCEQSVLGSEQSGLGRHAHRRTEDSILTIMAAMMPPQSDLSNYGLSQSRVC